MAQTIGIHGEPDVRPAGLRGVTADFSSDQRAFKTAS